MRHRKSSSYPLLFLIMFITVSAIMIRLVTPVIRSLVDHPDPGITVSSGDYGLATIALILTGIIAGVFVGACHFHRSLGVLIGVISGAAVGFMTTPFLFIPLRLGSLTTLMTCFAAVVIVATGVILTRSKAKQMQESTSSEKTHDPDDFAHF